MRKTPSPLLATSDRTKTANFSLIRNALRHMKEGSAIIKATSVSAYVGSPVLLDYISTKGAIVAFTRSLALQLLDKGIRVNGVAPGSVRARLQPTSMPEDMAAN
ncbi:unnamed protein product [Ilex paraguariensis]|uniref:SDR family oxidoreductase n=1 Tax=Ilex paraguariensis TaxID=185542 RepID=A0ABC8QY81_9AQUA